MALGMQHEGGWEIDITQGGGTDGSKATFMGQGSCCLPTYPGLVCTC